jgi:hypothetical protein
MDKLVWRLGYHPVVGVGVVPDHALDEYPDVFLRDVIHCLGRNVDMAGIRDKHETCGQRDWLVAPISYCGTASKYFMYAKVGASKLSAGRDFACVAKGIVHCVAHEVSAVIVVGVSKSIAADMVNVLTDKAI